MKKIALVLFGLFLSLFLLELVLQAGSFFISICNDRKAASGNNQSKRLLCVGDSYTFGLGVKKNESYPAQLQQLLDSEHGKGSYEVINTGRPGLNTAMLSKELPEWLDIYDPAMVLVMIGVNDTWNFQECDDAKNFKKTFFSEFLKKLRISKLFRILKMQFLNQKKLEIPTLQIEAKETKELLKRIESLGGFNNAYYYYAIMLGNEYRKEKRYHIAKHYYDAASKINPKGLEVNLERGRFYLEIFLQDNFEKNTEVLGDTGKSKIKNLDIEVTPDMLQDEALESELKELQKVIVRRGNEYRENNENEKAEKYYMLASNLNDNSSDADIELLRSMKNLIQGNEKDDYLDQILSLVSKDIALQDDEKKDEFLDELVNLAIIFKDKNFYGALAFLVNARRLGANVESVYEEMDEIFIAHGNAKLAIAIYQWLDSEYPNDKEIYLRLARQYKRVMDYQRSIEYFKKYLSLAPEKQEINREIQEAQYFINQGLSTDFEAAENELNSFKIFLGLLKNETPEAHPERMNSATDSSLNYEVGAYVKAGRYDREIEEKLLKEKNYSKLFDKIDLNSKDIGRQRLKIIEKISDEAIMNIYHMCTKRGINILFISYPLNIPAHMAKITEHKRDILLDVSPIFRSLITPENMTEFFQKDGHCTAKGNEIIAKTVSEYIVKNLP